MPERGETGFVYRSCLRSDTHHVFGFQVLRLTCMGMKMARYVVQTGWKKELDQRLGLKQPT